MRTSSAFCRSYSDSFCRMYCGAFRWPCSDTFCRSYFWLLTSDEVYLSQQLFSCELVHLWSCEFHRHLRMQRLSERSCFQWRFRNVELCWWTYLLWWRHYLCLKLVLSASTCRPFWWIPTYYYYTRVARVLNFSLEQARTRPSSRLMLCKQVKYMFSVQPGMRSISYTRKKSHDTRSCLLPHI